MKSKTKKKNKNKRKVKVQGNKFSFWLENHSIIASIIEYCVFLPVAIGVAFLTFGNKSIPGPLREFKYISPLYLNLTILIALPYYSWFGSLREEGFNMLKGFSEVFLYLNCLLFLLHYFIGIELEHGEGFLPPLWNLNSRYVWFPIATYILFFSIAGLANLIAFYLERKKKCPVPKKQS